MSRMRFVFDPELLSYMKQKGKKNLAVEVASTSHSDFDVTEIYYRLVDDRAAGYMAEKKHYRAVDADGARVLLPPYRLQYAETVTFRRQKVWLFHKLTAEGISL